MTAVEPREIDRRLPVLLPLAAVEQHGPHLPGAIVPKLVRSERIEKGRRISGAGVEELKVILTDLSGD